MSTKVIKFSAEWCAPCKEYAPIVSKVLKDYPDVELEEVSIDTDSGVELASDYGIRGVPTTIIYKGDEFVIKVGVVPEADLREALNE